jgi:GMP synthase (glutamine-hydrolysing)
LASTELCRNQAFAIGRRVVGFQFHPEATGRSIEHWLVGHAAELAAAGIDVRRLRADALRHGPELTAKAKSVMSAWLAAV